MNRMIKCAVCGKAAKPGSAVVVAYGAGGRTHKTCLLPGKISLADGSSYVSTVKVRPASNAARERVSQERMHVAAETPGYGKMSA